MRLPALAALGRKGAAACSRRASARGLDAAFSRREPRFEARPSLRFGPSFDAAFSRRDILAKGPMERDSDLRRILADEIRAAIAETAPEPGAGRTADDSVTGPARAALDRAADVMTPSVPSGAPLEPVKRFAIRAMRFLWRNQSAFNSLSIDASARLSDAVERLRVELEALARRSGVQEARLTLAEAVPPRSTPAGAGPPARADGGASPIPAGVYALFEERFRGRPEDIERGQRAYLELLKGAPGPVLDVGCGRGEFLKLLSEAGRRGFGIESNPVSAAACRAAGLEVEEADAFEALAGREAASLGAVVAFQVVEHWPPPTIFRFLQEARRLLAPGGVLIAETVNTDSLAALRSFYLDPTHVRPVPPEALRFLAEAAGLTDARIEFRAPLPSTERLEERTENDRKLNALLFGAQDYALVARVASAP
jgi:SAM-dependent methyltransferase